MTGSQVSNFHSQDMHCHGKKRYKQKCCCGNTRLIMLMYYVFFLFSVFVPAVVPPLTHYLSSRWYIIFPQPHSGELRFLQGRELLFFFVLVLQFDLYLHKIKCPEHGIFKVGGALITGIKNMRI